MLEIFKISAKNIFKQNIANFNVLVGKNGVGKTIIINNIYNSLHGSVTKELLIILMKKHEIIVYCQDDDITVDYEAVKKYLLIIYLKYKKKALF